MDDGEAVVPVANRLMDQFDLVVATQDWHVAGHRSFASQHPGKAVGDVVELMGLEQILWPDHCVQGTGGAEFVAELNAGKIDVVFRKGVDREIDSYSAFFDNAHRNSTGLGDYLKKCDVDTVYIMGLATDYCVKFSALDAVELGLAVYVVIDGCRGVEVNDGDVESAITTMVCRGVHVVTSDKLDNSLITSRR